MEKNEAIRDLRIAGTEIFHYLQELKEIDNKQYHQICDISRILPESIQQLKDDGYYYFFPDEWLNPKEKKLKEMMNKLLTGKDEPLMRL